MADRWCRYSVANDPSSSPTGIECRITARSAARQGLRKASGNTITPFDGAYVARLIACVKQIQEADDWTPTDGRGLSLSSLH